MKLKIMLIVFMFGLFLGCKNRMGKFDVYQGGIKIDSVCKNSWYLCNDKNCESDRVEKIYYKFTGIYCE